MKELLSKLNKKHYISFLLFLTGYLFALTNSEKNLIELLKHFSPFYFAISNIIYFFMVLLIVKTLLKKYKYFEFKEEDDNLHKTIVLLKLVFIGYFLGAFTILGNAFITVLFL